MKNALEIIRDGLIAMGADGLCYPDDWCACSVDDLAPCHESPSNCVAAKKVTGCSEECGEGCDSHYMVMKKAGSKADYGACPVCGRHDLCSACIEIEECRKQYLKGIKDVRDEFRKSGDEVDAALREVGI